MAIIISIIVSIVAVLISFFLAYNGQQRRLEDNYKYQIDRGDVLRNHLTEVLLAYEKQLRTGDVKDTEYWMALLQTTSLNLPLMMNAAFDNGDSPDTYLKKIKQHINDEPRLGPVSAGDTNLQERALRAEIVGEAKKLNSSQEQRQNEIDALGISLTYTTMRKLGLKKNQIDEREKKRLAREDERAALEDQKPKIKPIDPPSSEPVDPASRP